MVLRLFFHHILPKNSFKSESNLGQIVFIFPNIFYGWHFGTSNQIHLEDTIDSSVFYLVRSVEVATIKSVWKNENWIILSSLWHFMCLGPNLGMFLVAMLKTIGIGRFLAKKRF